MLECIELKEAVHLTYVSASVIYSDVLDTNGEVLQVLAAVPHQTALPLQIYILWLLRLIVIQIDL